MSDPRVPVEGAAGVGETVSGQLGWTHDTADTISPGSVAQSVTPVACGFWAHALAYLRGAGLCACWTVSLRRCGAP